MKNTLNYFATGQYVMIRFWGTTDEGWQGDVSIDDIGFDAAPPACTPGTTCDDGDACTTGDVYDANCNCAGTFADADGDGLCVGNDPDDTDPCNPNACNTCGVFASSNFEGGWGIWNDGGSDCRRSANDAAYANSGSYSVRLRDNSGATSSMYTDVLDLSAYTSIDVSFSFITSSMENNEDFFLEISNNGGSSYTIAQEWNSGAEFVNGTRYNETVTINGAFSNNTRLRIRCDASANNDRVYIDDVIIEACGALVQLVVNDDNPIAKLETPEPYMILYPNPASQYVNLELHDLDLSLEEQMTVAIYSLEGKQVYENRMSQTDLLHIDIAHLPANQMYLLHLRTDDGRMLRAKFLKL